ncbi:uncharacterized protein LOC114527010 [Dendronephthya gigantea]|uniref:uncharacterized protein LOC114527010 n=1 Tax=Dendronephthya gigantea TaxID=151771 RepID=UPI001068D886|nr:uncharacterized protein LOC114527010 [Dendronephthya gigantea]
MIYRQGFLLLLVLAVPLLADYLQQCLKTPIEENVTLKGGIGAGTFKKMGKVTEMKSCIQLCCKELSCDVAFMSAQNCYAVECVSDDECESTTTDTSDVQVLIAHVKKRAKKSSNATLDVLANPGLLAKKSPLATGANPAMAGMAGQCKAGKIYKEVTLRGGINAGTYKDMGMVSGMPECQKKCCGFSACDIAFLLGGRCYLVGCADEKSCQMNKAKPSAYAPTISYVTRWNTEGVKHTVHFESPSGGTHFRCPRITPLTKVTLKGGLKAGDFTDVGKVGKLTDCYDICCRSAKCDLAFMLGQNCFNVKCYNQDLCTTIPAQPSIFNPQIAYITSREKISFDTEMQDKIQGNNVQTVTHVTCPKGHVVNKVTLSGGLNAGRYRDHGKVKDIQQCRRICCEIPKCNVAFMISENCFSVECKTEPGCRTQAAVSSQYHPRISYVRFIGSSNIIGVFNDMNETVKNSTKSLDDLLSAGAAKQLVKSKTTPNPQGENEDDMPVVPPPKKKPGKQNTKATEKPQKTNILLMNGDTTDLASALQSAKTTTPKPRNNNTLLTSQLKNAKAGQAMSLQMVNGELKLTSTHGEKSHGKEDNKDQPTSNEKQEAKGTKETEKKSGSCKAVKLMKDVTLSGGKSAGKFTEHGQVDSMDKCVEFCCKDKKCNMVLLLGKACYSVACKNKKSCGTSPAPPSNFVPKLAIVRPVEENDKKVERLKIPETPKSLKCNFKPTTNDKKLTKGKEAGTFKLVKHITSMGDCMKKCCDQTICDLAYLENGKCFTVTCKTPDSCATTVAKDNEKSPLIAFTTPVETPSSKEITSNAEENEATPSRDPRCKTSKIIRNSKLTGAKLTDMGTVDHYSTCITQCCRKESCDAAYMEDQKCYAVQCQDLECQKYRKPANKDENTFIAFMHRTVDDAEKERDWVIVYVIVGSLVCASGLSGIIWASCICVKRNRLRNKRRLIDDASEEEEEEMIPKQYTRYNNPVPRRYR